MRPGDPRIPILYEVDRIRDGRSFTTRRVVAIQHGRAIYNMQASFHTDEVSLEHQFDMPDVPAPETIAPALRAVQEEFGDIDEWFKRQHPIDQRFIGELPVESPAQQGAAPADLDQADGTLPDDPLLHACVVTYASDMSLFDAILAPHSIRWDDGIVHGREPRPLHVVPPRRCGPTSGCSTTPTRPSPTAGAASHAASSSTRTGELCVSMVQEGLTRVVDPAQGTGRHHEPRR